VLPRLARLIGEGPSSAGGRRRQLLQGVPKILEGGSIASRPAAAFFPKVESDSGAPMAASHAYGEIARIRMMRGFHNQTVVVLSIA
jgi:hypothetical protein